MKKKIFLGLVALPLLVVGGWLVLKLPFIMEGKACLGRDHIKGASACAKLLSRKEFADQDLARATMVLTQAAHLLTLPDGRKLRGLKDFAAHKGVTNMSGEEIELMNLSGPGTGLEMMQPTGLTAPTPNFFARRAYYVNKMVIDKTSAELLAEFTRRMDSGSRKPGAVEFAEAFDEVAGVRQTGIQGEALPWR